VTSSATAASFALSTSLVRAAYRQLAIGLGKSSVGCDAYEQVSQHAQAEDATMPQEHRAGEKLFVDVSACALSWLMR